MKKMIIKGILAALVGIISPLLAKAGTKEQQDAHALTSLWKQYDAASKSDLPATQLEILDQIKSCASEKSLPWDFYDAAVASHDVELSRNWKLRDSLDRRLSREISGFGSPMLSVWYKYTIGGSGMLDFIKDNEQALLSGNDRFFAAKAVEGSKSGLMYVNDYESALWLAMKRSSYREEAASLLARRLEGRYPLAECLEFEMISGQNRKSELLAFAEKYSGKAVALFAREALLNDEYSNLTRYGSKAGQDEFKELRKKCADFQKSRNAFRGAERKLAYRCDLSSIIGELDSENISAQIKDGLLKVEVRNISSVRASIKDESGKTVWSSRIPNSLKSYYVNDTLKKSLPRISDGDYTLYVKSGDKRFEAEYEKHTISLANRQTDLGIEIYAADYMSGEPVAVSDLEAEYEDGSIETYRDFKFDAFTLLPEDMLSTTDSLGKLRALSHLRCIVTDADGFIRSSGKISLWWSKNKCSEHLPDPTLRGAVITDCGIYRPGDEVRFKAILYEDAELVKDRDSRVLEGNEMKLSLLDADHKEIASSTLVTGEFGSASGSFKIPEEGRHGAFTITLSLASKRLSSTSFRVEELVLPTYEVRFDSQGKDYFPGDTVTLTGRIKSYSGANMADVEVECKVSNSYSGDGACTLIPVEIASDGTFRGSFKSSEKIAGRHISWYNVSLKVTDRTGETLETGTSVRISDRPSSSLEIVDSEEGSFTTDNTISRKAIISGNVLRFKLSSADNPSNASASYRITSDGKLLCEGTAPLGEICTVTLPLGETSLCVLETTVSKPDDRGTLYKSDPASYALLVIPDSKASTLPRGVKDLVMPLEEEGSIGLRLGNANAPVWAIVEVWGSGNKVLRRGKMELASESPLAECRFEYKDEYPDAVALSLFYFKDGDERNWTKVFRRSLPRTAVPLEIMKESSEASPSSTYSLRIKTVPDAECAVAVFDKASERYNPNKWSALPLSSEPYPSVNIAASCGADQTEWGRVLNRGFGRLLTKSANMVDSEDGSVAVDAVPCAQEEELETIEERNDFQNILAFEPHLWTDSKGEAVCSFETSDKLSTYLVNILAHDKNARSASSRTEFMVTMPFQLSVVQPRFLYEGDRYVLHASVSGKAGTSLKGSSMLTVSDSEREIFRLLKPFEMPESGSAELVFELPEIPSPASGLLAVRIAVSAKDADAHKATDALSFEIPVRKPVQTVRESHSAVILSGDDIASKEKLLREEFVNVPSAESTSRTISIDEMLREVMEGVAEPKGKDAISTAGAAAVRMLLGNADASGLLDELLGCRNVDGGFAWRQGMKSSPAVTAYVLETFALVSRRGLDIPEVIGSLLPDAIRYLDSASASDKTVSIWSGGISLAQYAYVRSMYPDVAFDAGPSKGWKSAAREYFDMDTPLTGRILDKVRRLVTLENLLSSGDALCSAWGLKSDKRLLSRVRLDIESISQYAVDHPSGGSYYPNAVMPFRGLFESEAYAHSLICDALSKHRPALSDGIRLWLMVQKETQKWPTDPCCVNAVMSILDGSKELLDTKVLVLSGESQLPFSEISASGNGMKVSRKFMVRKGNAWVESEDVKTGDVVRVEYTLESDENRSFVVFEAPHPASLTPVERLSGCRGSYRDVSSDKIQYWYTSFPEGKLILTEDYYVTSDGSFQSPAPEIVCRYADHYSAVGTAWRLPKNHKE